MIKLVVLIHTCLVVLPTARFLSLGETQERIILSCKIPTADHKTPAHTHYFTGKLVTRKKSDVCHSFGEVTL